MILIIMGVAGSGKTTVGKRLASDLSWPFYDGDDFHPSANIAKMRNGAPLTDEDRFAWLAALRRLMDRLLCEQTSAVLACSALKHAYREQLQGTDTSVHFIYLKGSYELIHQRIEGRRDHFMKADLLASQYDALEEPAEALTVDASAAPATIIEKIRKTLAV